MTQFEKNSIHIARVSYIMNERTRLLKIKLMIFLTVLSLFFAALLTAFIR